MDIVKYILPVVAGCIVGITLITFGEMGLQHVYSLPAGIDPHNKEALGAAIKAMPIGAFMALLANYAFASFGGGLVASLVTGRTSPRAAIVVGIVLTAAGMINVFTIPQPVWFVIANLLVYIPFAYLGFLVVRRKISPQPPGSERH